MKKILISMICMGLVGCAGLGGPEKSQQERRVRTLGVLPVMIDVDSIRYSSPDGLVALLEKSSRKVDDWLVERLRDKGDYFDVRLVDGPAGEFYRQLVSAGVRSGDKAAAHHVYSFDPEGSGRIVNDYLVDAILVVVINGIERTEKRWSEYGASLQYLITDYRSLLYTASVVMPSGEKIWTRTSSPGDFFLRLDYPDFLEAYWNRTDVVKVKEITLPGLDRALSEVEKGLFVKTEMPKKYNQMVRELVDQLKSGL